MADDTFYWWQSFLILCWGFPLVFVTSSWIVAKFIWEPMVKKSIEQTKSLPPLPYEQRYPFIYDETIQDNSGNILVSAMVLEHTPQGCVLLQYNEDQRAFDYWADAEVQYKYLETVCRKFVQSFRCEHLYINRYEELNKNWKLMKEEAEKAEKEEKEGKKEVDSVFATLKAANPPSKKRRRVPTCNKANKYIKRGRLNECDYFKSPLSEKNSFSFDDWKQITL